MFKSISAGWTGLGTGTALQMVSFLAPELKLDASSGLLGMERTHWHLPFCIHTGTCRKQDLGYL